MLPTLPRREYIKKNKFYPNGGKLTIMPFTVGLESIVLQVKDSDSSKEQLEVVNQIIQNCVKEDISKETLPTFVIEELFLRMREISGGEIVPLNYRCKSKYTPKDEDGQDKVDENCEKILEECNNIIEYKFDLRNFKIKESENHTNIIMLDDGIGIKFKYPSINDLEKFEETEDENDLIISCIESIFKDDEVWLAKEQTEEELKTFFKQILSIQKSEIKNKFLYTMPKIHFHDELVCSKCGAKIDLSFNSLSDVFI